MNRIIIGEKRITDFVAKKTNEEDFGTCASIGLVNENDKLIAGVVYNMWSGYSINMHIGAEKNSNWFSRRFATYCFNATFGHFKCNRATALVRKKNIKAQKFVLKLGFIEEGIVRQACHDGEDVVMFGMLASECRFLKLKDKQIKEKEECVKPTYKLENKYELRLGHDAPLASF